MGNIIRLDDYPIWPVLPILLKDKTMKRNIIWATASYASMGEYYVDSAQMTENALRNMGENSIQPRILKAQEDQQKRTRAHGEVQTPAWICCRMNNYLDEEWFGRKDVFNVQDGCVWTSTEDQINFPKPGRRHSNWKCYVDSRRLEITCGEAPFIVSRYDAATGESIPIERRIGVLDRKLRIVGENADNEYDWLKWALRAIQSVYGYEYQGDNLLIARINVLLTFVEYLEHLWHRKPTEQELKTVANVIVWNFWQMDGLTGTVPKGKLQAPEPEIRPITMEELGWFDGIDGGMPLKKPSAQEMTPLCRVCNWRQEHAVTFVSLNQRGKDVRNMRFDFCIGNPPYQEERQGDSNTATPVYHLFMSASYESADKVMLITPARFLFNAGYTPKDWNKGRLNDPHFKVEEYYPNAAEVFQGVDIKGGVAITYRDPSIDFGAIEVFTIFPMLNQILHKVIHSDGFVSLSTVVVTSFAYHFTEQMYTDNPELIGRASKGHAYDLQSNAFDTFPELFSDSVSQPDQFIRILGRSGNQRCWKYIKRDYVTEVGNVEKYKVFMSKAAGTGQFGETLPDGIIGNPGDGGTITFTSIGFFETEDEAYNCNKYIKSKFTRALLGVLKVTQDLTPGKWAYVPFQDFTPGSDIDWTQPIPVIDQQLYRKYDLTDEEVAFIESHVKEMT